MSSYLNNLFNTTASRVASLKQNLLPSENDGDTEDDTHICRVLRGYYTEKGRAFPAWLPPDPRAPPPVVIQPVYTQSNVGRGYGGLNNGDGGGAGRGGSALSSLWDSQPQQSMQQDPQSLRPGRSGGLAPSAGNRLGSSGGGGVTPRHNPFSRQPSTQQEAQIQARPLPSQRAGSYQTAGGSPFARDAGVGGVAMSAKDKLKGQFGQGARRAASPALSDQGQAQQGYGRNESYSPAPPPGGGGIRGQSYGSSGGGGERPFVSANSPWASNESEFSGGGYGAGNDGRGGGRQQPYQHPGSGRRNDGLPSGPRGPRSGY